MSRLPTDLPEIFLVACFIASIDITRAVNLTGGL
jgi:hypothetical protein